MKNRRAFPRPLGFNGCNEYSESQQGMDLRTYIACKALIGIMSQERNVIATAATEEGRQFVVRQAFEIADEMLKQGEDLK